jgi:hypothetical protein
MTERSDDADRERLEKVPEHEIDDDRDVGGGVLSMGGTATDAGTGTTRADEPASGQPIDEEDDDAGRGLGAPPAAPGTPSVGGAVVGDPTPRPDPMSDHDVDTDDDARTVPLDPTRVSPSDQNRR